MKELKRFNMFESLNDENDNDTKMIEILESIVKKKNLLLMLEETINHVTDEVVKNIPIDTYEGVMNIAHHHDSQIYECLDRLLTNLIGVPSINEMIENVNDDIKMLEDYIKYLKLKDDNKI